MVKLDILSGAHLIIGCVTAALRQAFLSLACDMVDYYRLLLFPGLILCILKGQISIPMLDNLPDRKKRHLNPKHRLHHLQSRQTGDKPNLTATTMRPKPQQLGSTPYSPKYIPHSTHSLGLSFPPSLSPLPVCPLRSRSGSLHPYLCSTSPKLQVSP